MYQLSATLREKPEWWRKFKDPEIRKKWFEEAKAQQAEVEERWRLTDNMVRVQLIDVSFVLMARRSTTRLGSWRITPDFRRRKRGLRYVNICRIFYMYSLHQHAVRPLRVHLALRQAHP